MRDLCNAHVQLARDWGFQPPQMVSHLHAVLVRTDLVLAQTFAGESDDCQCAKLVANIWILVARVSWYGIEKTAWFDLHITPSSNFSFPIQIARKEMI